MHDGWDSSTPVPRTRRWASIMSKVVPILALPVIAFSGGLWLMSQMSDREYVLQRLNESTLSSSEKIPLNQRPAYDREAVARYLKAFDARALTAERKFLEMDLIFPFIYGGALAISLLLTWHLLGRPFSPLWIIAPLALMALADWTENLIHLSQLKRFVLHGESALESSLIQIASLATCIKLLFSFVLVMLFIGLVLWMLVRPHHTPP